MDHHIIVFVTVSIICVFIIIVIIIIIFVIVSIICMIIIVSIIITTTFDDLCSLLKVNLPSQRPLARFS